MPDTQDSAETHSSGAGESSTPAPRRSPGHRATDAREALAELTARAHEIGQEANNRMAGAMRDMIAAAAGLAGFAVESARELVQFMVRRGQMTQDEADRLIADAEAAAPRKVTAPPRASAAEQRHGSANAPANDHDSDPATGRNSRPARKKSGGKKSGGDGEAATAQPTADAAAADSAPTKGTSGGRARKSAVSKKAGSAPAGEGTARTTAAKKTVRKSSARSAKKDAAPAEKAEGKSRAKPASKSAAKPASKPAAKSPRKASASRSATPKGATTGTRRKSSGK